MFSLIISIIAIALVVALAAASLYYGGDAFTAWHDKAAAAQYRNEGSQISGAISLYQANVGSIPADFEFADLAPLYLETVPEGDWVTKPSSNLIVRTGLSDGECVASNEVMGFTFLMTDVNSADYQQSTSDPSKGVPMCLLVENEVPCCNQ